MISIILINVGNKLLNLVIILKSPGMADLKVDTSSHRINFKSN